MGTPMTRLRWMIALVLVLAVGHVPAASTRQEPSQTTIYTAYAYEGLAVDNTAGGVGWSTALLNQPAQNGRTLGRVLFRVRCASSSPCSIFARWDGTAPTASTGYPLDEDDVFELDGAINIKRFRAIRSGANDAVLHSVLQQY